MALKDWMNLFRKQNGRGEGDTSRRPDGGTSCYRPMRKRIGPQMPEMQEENPGQPMTYVHTGFTGMNPPAWGGYDPNYAPQQDPYGQGNPYGQPAPYAPQNPYEQVNAYAQQPAYPQNAYAQPGMQNPQDPYGRPGEMPMPAQQNYFPQQAAREERRGAARPERGWFPAREEPKQPAKLSYMPGFEPAQTGGFTHVEHILAVTGLKSCYEAIECMKNGETLILTLDMIANEGESMRCQDILAGAAFTLGCTLRILLGGRLVLIAPEGVHILPEETAAPIQMMPPVYQTPAAVPESAPSGRRERRSGSNAAEWAAARNGEMDNYNPYTGTMPAAAGAYGSFGGYGY